MNVLDLFSGIGGFSLGLERAGMRTVAFCEIDPYCRAVLAEHWPDVPVWGDIRTLRFDRNTDDQDEHGRAVDDEARPRMPEPGAIDLICGGFPCQDISVAGKGAGLDGTRSGLWGEYARVIGEVRPRYVIVENVAALLGRGLARVLGDLAALGFDAEWHCIPASAVGAPHRRDRVWIVADADTGRELQPQRSVIDFGRWLGNSGWWRVEPDVGRVAYGVPARVDRLRSLGNAVVPQISEIIGRAIVNGGNHVAR